MKKFLAIMTSALLLVGTTLGLTACGTTSKVGSQSGTTGFNYASYIKGVEAVDEYYKKHPFDMNKVMPKKKK